VGDEGADIVNGDRVDAGKRLIEQDEIGLGRQRPGNFTAPPLAARRWLTLSLCAGLFLLAVGVRLLYWQDAYAELARGEPWMADLARQYKSEAQRMREGDGVLFPRQPVDLGDARGLLHPPGYSMLMAAIFSVGGESNSAVRWVQISGDGLAVVMLFLIAAELLNGAIAMIAGLLAALSPHLAFYSLWLSPDSLAVLPILLAVYFIIKASQRPRLITVIAAGAMIGVSCWLRANALMLAPLLALTLAALVGRGKRLRYGLALIGATVIGRPETRSITTPCHGAPTPSSAAAMLAATSPLASSAINATRSSG